MTKREIVRTISESVGLTQLKTKEVVERTFDVIVEAMITEGRIEFRNFGVFEVRTRAARNARNPITGEQVHVPARQVVVFKPSKEMKARVCPVTRAEMEARKEEEAQKKEPPVVSPDVPVPAPDGMGSVSSMPDTPSQT